jgi:sugar transferase EpsL
MAKKVFDFTGGIVLLILTTPVLIILAVLVKIKMGSPVFFRQTRPGLGGRPFNLLKFRTMNNALEGQGELFSDEQRLTKLGQKLRKYSLDELPQLINVVRGDLSFVGPRPLLMQYLDRYTQEQARRHEVKPGITGWAQVNGRNAISWEEKFELDIWYVDNRSFLLDLKILWLTVVKVLRAEGISGEGSATMSEFMGSDQ